MAGDTYDPYDPYSGDQVDQNYLLDWWGNPMGDQVASDGTYQPADGSGWGSFGNATLPAMLMAGDPNEQFQPFTKTAPMTFSQISSLMNNLTKPIKAPPQVNWDKLLDEQLTNYKRSLSDADTQNWYGLNMYEDPRTAGVVQSYVNDLQSGKITPEDALKNFNYRTGQTDRDGNPRQKNENTTSLYMDALNNAAYELDKKRAHELAPFGDDEITASVNSYKWMNENLRGVSPNVDAFLNKWADPKYSLDKETSRTTDDFAQEARKFIDSLRKDDVGERLTKYGKDPRLNAPAYAEAMKNLRGIDPNLDKFFTENNVAARVATNPQLLEQYNRMIGDLNSPQAAARRKGLPLQDAPGDLEFLPDQSRAAIQEMFQKGGRARQQLPRMPTPREQLNNMTNMMLMMLMIRQPKK